MIIKNFIKNNVGQIRSFLSSRFPLMLNGNVISGLGQGSMHDDAACMHDVWNIKDYVNQTVAGQNEKVVVLPRQTALYAINPFEKVIVSGVVKVTLTLPLSLAVGQRFGVLGSGGVFGWTIAQQEGQQIMYGNQQTTQGAQGAVYSTLGAASCRLTAVTPSLLVVEWSTDPLQMI